jgi:AraC family transcriptional activator of pyochelin receptor
MLIELLEITEDEGREIEIFQELPAGMQPFAIHGSTPILLQGDSFRILLQEFQGKGFSAWYNRYWMDRATILRARGPIPVLELRIGLINQLEGSWDKIVQPSLKPGQFNLSFTPHIETKAIFDTGKYYATFDIHVHPSLLEEIGIDYRELRKFLNKVEKGHPAELADYPHDCPAAMQDGIQFILNNPYSAKAQPRILEWNIKQILLIALETVASPEHPLPITLTPREIEGLHAIKQFIADSFPDWPDHASLCRKGEINEFKLKMGFKHLFNMTAYDFHMQLKFREAKKLLLEGKESISAVAYQIGYHDHASFSQEFKKQFGYTPTWFKKHGRL